MVQVLTAVVLSMVVSGAQGTKPAHAVVESYLEIQAALAQDSLEGVTAAANRIAEQSANIGAAGAPLAKVAKAVGSAKDIKAARTAFGPLSEAVIAVVKADPSAHDVKLAYCPMANASWLQKEEKIRNPYYGSSMLTCGEFKEIK